MGIDGQPSNIDGILMGAHEYLMRIDTQPSNIDGTLMAQRQYLMNIDEHPSDIDVALMDAPPTFDELRWVSPKYG